MRLVTDHHDGHGLTESIRLIANEPGLGGASHEYQARIDTVASDGDVIVDATTVASIQFQCGPRHHADSTPGIVESVLLAIVIDRMRSFQAGEYGCRENALVLTKCEEALHWLKHRADQRAKRGVLGTYTK